MDLNKNLGDIVNKVKDTINVENFNPDKRINEFREYAVNTLKEIFNPDSRVDQFNSTEEDRIKFTPLENNEYGIWNNGKRGNGEFVPNKDTEEGIKVSKALEKYDLKGIIYRNGIPDFSNCSEEIVSIDNMTNNRYTNYEQANVKLADQWNKLKIDGRVDWTAREIESYRKENNLTWHECSDLKTCMLVNRTIHDFFIHSGGIFEYNQGQINKDDGGIFDE